MVRKMKYKLTDKNMETYNGYKWELGVRKEITKEGDRLCSDKVFHFYDSPHLAVLLNPIHANFQEYRLFEIECDGVSHDGLKGGSKWQILKKEIPAPEITLIQKVEFGIRCAMEVYFEKEWVKWAKGWLAGKRSKRATESAAERVESAAENVVESAKWAAESAVERVEWAAARAEWAVESAKWAAESAAKRVEWAAESAARAEWANKMKKIVEIIFGGKNAKHNNITG